MGEEKGVEEVVMAASGEEEEKEMFLFLLLHSLQPPPMLMTMKGRTFLVSVVFALVLQSLHYQNHLLMIHLSSSSAQPFHSQQQE
jgi:hypothetical protein